MAETTPSGDRLDSWKEIAKYLNRTERTVSRWEKHGLPVHRIPGGQKQAVFAYKHELDEWLKRGDISDAGTIQPSACNYADLNFEVAVGQTPSGKPNSSSTEVIPRIQSEATGKELPSVPLNIAPEHLRSSTQVTGSSKRRFIALLIGILGIIAVISSGRVFFHKASIARIAHLQKMTRDGYPKTNLRNSVTGLYFNELESNWQIVAIPPSGSGETRKINSPFPNVELQDVSTDGQSLLITSFEGTWDKGGRPLWIMPVQGGKPHRVGNVLCDLARWSPDNRQIACVNGASILLFDTDGSGIHNVGSFPAMPRSLVWSSSGEKLRFVVADLTARTQTPWELTFNKDKSAPSTTAAVLPLGINCCWSWMWTHDSKNFLYTKHDVDGRAALFLGTGDGASAHETKIPVQISGIGDLAPGKADNQLYVLMGDTYRGQLFKFDSKSKVFQTFLPGLSADCLSFSPDGLWITYVSLPDQSLWRSRVDGSEAIQLTSPPMEAEYSAWSPDGRQIAFMGKKSGKPWRIFLVNRDGGVMKEAAQGNDNQGAPTWSVDGKKLAYGNVSCEETHSCWIRLLELAHGEEELLPGSNGFRTARWSPDGKYIAALRPQAHELMLFDVRMRRWTTLADSITGDNLNWSSDSQYIYADTLWEKKTVIERVRIKDGQRDTLADLSSLQKSFGQLDYWIGLAPDNSPLVLQQFTEVEIYAVEWTN